MGAQTSSPGDEGQSSNRKTRACYYDLLGVGPQATDQEIKKAYRRKALELHPDRNLNDVDAATKKFADIQSAYEILSDPQERAWYDSHRDAILGGQDDVDSHPEPTAFRNVRLTTTDEILSLVRKFNAATPFNDEPTGFFGSLKETFRHLALEEEVAADVEGTDCPPYPTFGCANDKYEMTVKTFYSCWSGFSTRKTFSWKDKYRLSDAPDRRVRRLMEKENKKLRDEAVRELNDAVRFLVLFVRKRDPRYLPNSQTESDRQVSLRSASAAQAARSRAANLEKLSAFEIPEWACPRDDDPDANHASDGEEESQVESEVVIIECVVCSKSFKSDQQLEAHERSKKHIKALQQLRRQMQKEGMNFALDSGAADPAGAPMGNLGSEKQDLNTVEYRAKTAGPSASSEFDSDDRIEYARDNAGDGSAAHYSYEPRISQGSSTDVWPLENALETRSFGISNSTPSLLLPEATESSPDDALASLTSSLETVSVGQRAAREEVKLGKAKAKRQRKAAALQALRDEHRCSVCNTTFTSRTQLFNHIHAENHAAPISQPGSNGSKKKRRG